MKKKSYALIVALIMILSITFGYAFLSANLNINGTSSINNSSWNIHFENIVVNEDSVTASEPVLDTNRTTVTYEVALSKPGDFYEFTVDVKNDGSIDAMIDTVLSTLNNSEITVLPSYLNYSVTYSDGNQILSKQELLSGSKETYKVRLEFKKDIQVSDLPTTAQTLNLSFTVIYTQKDDTSIARPRYYYGFSNNPYLESVSNFTGTLYNTYEESTSASGLSYSLRYKVVNDIIEETSIVFYRGSSLYELKYDNVTSFENRKLILDNIFGSDTCRIDNSKYICGTGSDLQVAIYSSGSVEAYKSGILGCIVSDKGCSYCAIVDWTVATMRCSNKF